MTLCDVCSAEGYPYDKELCKNCEHNPNKKEEIRMNKWITTKSGKRIKVQKKSNWVSVTDGLPDKDGKYLVFGKVALSDINGEPIQLVRFTERKEWLTSLSVEYWMPLPTPPKENDNDD